MRPACGKEVPSASPPLALMWRLQGDTVHSALYYVHGAFLYGDASNVVLSFETTMQTRMVYCLFAQSHDW